MKLSQLLGGQDIVLGMLVKQKRSALGALAARLGDRTGRSEGAVLNALLRRERLGSTAVGHGVAIPHARLDGISAPAAVVASLQRPVSFNSPDHAPVDLILGIVWPPSDTPGFVQALSSYCCLLCQPGLRDRLRAAGSPTEARARIESFEEGTSASSGGDARRTGYTLREARAWARPHSEAGLAKAEPAVALLNDVGAVQSLPAIRQVVASGRDPLGSPRPIVRASP